MKMEQAIKHPMEHRLKCWPEYFKAVKDGLKPFEIRKWDRPYAVGDTLTLEEWNPEILDYTGDSIVREITYLLDLTYLPGDRVPNFAGYVALGLSNPTAAEALRAQQEREKGCYKCQTKIFTRRFGAGKNGDLFGYVELPHAFCPMCGRNLETKEAHNA